MNDRKSEIPYSSCPIFQSSFSFCVFSSLSLNSLSCSPYLSHSVFYCSASCLLSCFSDKILTLNCSQSDQLNPSALQYSYLSPSATRMVEDFQDSTTGALNPVKPNPYSNYQDYMANKPANRRRRKSPYQYLFDTEHTLLRQNMSPLRNELRVM